MAVAQAGGRQPRPRGPAILQVALALGVAVLLAAVTLTTRQTPPPAIAEFAPQAAEQIKEQPKEQASQFGSGNGPGDCPPGASCASGAGNGTSNGASTTTTTNGAKGPGTQGAGPAKPPPSPKRCVGNPPRQIEDPQSPPCVASWDDSKGNGGATAPGVTADTITIAAPGGGEGGTDLLYNALQNFFNDRFELYGRKVKWVKLADSNGAAAADDAKQVGAFASLPQYDDIPFYRELAHNKIVGTYRTPDFADSELAANAPYLWSYVQSFTQMEVSLGDWACHRLAGEPAALAGMSDAENLATENRKFGILMDIGTPDATVSSDVLKSALASCGAPIGFRDTYARFDEDSGRISAEIAQLKANHVTTVFCLCVSTNLQVLQTHATTQDYHPEWIITNCPQLIPGEWSGLAQVRSTFGLTFEPMERVREDQPVTWAFREGDPANAQAIYQSGASGGGGYGINYHAWLLLLSGIQMAGPNLTPETFRAGLLRTKFPNPDHPIMAGKVGFELGTGMTIDAAEFWVSYTDPGPYNGSQAVWCFVDGGKRHGRGTWTKGQPFHVGQCDAGTKSVS